MFSSNKQDACGTGLFSWVYSQRLLFFLHVNLQFRREIHVRQTKEYPKFLYRGTY